MAGGVAKESGALTTDTPIRAPPQAIDLIKQLQATSTLPIMRAQMRVRITMPSKDGKRIKTQVLALVDKVEDDDWADEWELVRFNALALGVCRLTLLLTLLDLVQVGLIDPGAFKQIDELIQRELKGKAGRIETLSFAAVEGEANIE